MKKCAFIFLVLAVCVCTSAFAQTKRVSFTDPNGNSWNRWVVREQQDGRILLYVYEDPITAVDQRTTTQVIVAKHVFSSTTPATQIRNKIQYYVDLKDHALRPADYYRKNGFEALDKTPKPLWVPAKNSWNIDDEKNFSAWYRAHASPDMAKDAGLLFDCADFGLLGRWIYAHDHKLPIANTLSGSGKLFGHFSESKSWSNLPTNADWKKDERFKAALRYLFESTYTRSIIGDLYPTLINRDFVTPGSILLTLRPDGTGHTQVLLDVGMQTYCGSECISVLYGNMPSRDIAYFSLAHLENHQEKTGGFLRWRWPVFKNNKWQLVTRTSMPGYSLEQYQHPEYSYDEFYTFIIDKLGFSIAPFYKAKALARSLTDDLRDRLINTAVGSTYCYFQYCDPSGTVYDDLSTPSKDKRFREKRDQLLRAMVTLTDSEKKELRSYYTYSLFATGERLTTFSNYIFNDDGISDRMSSDPTKSYAERWGLVDLSPMENAIIESYEFYLTMKSRIDLVYRAVSLCANGCDANSAEIKALSTAVIDDSLRKLQAKFYANYSAATELERSEIDKGALRYYLNEECKDNPRYSECYVKDYLLPGKDYLNKMTSNPTHPLRKRLGLE